jgi:hypothetical protein
MVSIKGFLVVHVLVVHEAVEIRLPVNTVRLGNQSRGRRRGYLLSGDTELSD